MQRFKPENTFYLFFRYYCTELGETASCTKHRCGTMSVWLSGRTYVS